MGMFGIWDSETDGEVHKIAFLFGQMIWQSNGETFDYEMPNEETVVLNMGDETFEATLSQGGDELVWDDGDVWTRTVYRPQGIIKGKPGGAKPKGSGRPRRRRRVHFRRDPEVRLYVSIEPWDLEHSDDEYSSDEEVSEDDDYGYSGESESEEEYLCIARPPDGLTIHSPSGSASNGGGMISPMSDTSIISTGGLYTPTTEVPPYHYIPPTQSHTSIPIVDNSLINGPPTSLYAAGDAAGISNKSLISTHTSDASFGRYESDSSFQSETTFLEYENVFEHFEADKAVPLYKVKDITSNSSIVSVGDAPNSNTVVADSGPLPTGPEGGGPVSPPAPVKMEMLATPANLDSLHLTADDLDVSSEDSSTSEEYEHTAFSPETRGKRFNSIILSTVAGPQHPDFKKFEPNFRLGMKLKRRPKPQNTRMGSPREVKESRQYRIMTRQATPYMKPTIQELSSAPDLHLNTEANVENQDGDVVAITPPAFTVKRSVDEGKAAIQRARSAMAMTPHIAPAGLPQRVASDRLLMSAERTMLQAASLLRKSGKKRRKKRFSLGVKKALDLAGMRGADTTPIQLVSPRDGHKVDKVESNSPVTGSVAEAFAVPSVHIINSPLKSTKSTELVRRTMISYASVASAQDSDDEDSTSCSDENSELQESVTFSPPADQRSTETAYLINTTSSFFDETSETNLCTEEEDSSVSDSVDAALSPLATTTTNDKKTRNSHIVSSKSRLKDGKKRRSFALGASKKQKGV